MTSALALRLTYSKWWDFTCYLLQINFYVLHVYFEYRMAEISNDGYSGTFIHPDAKANCSVDLNKWITTELNATINSFRLAGVTNSEIRIAFGNVMNNPITRYH